MNKRHSAVYYKVIIGMLSLGLIYVATRKRQSNAKEIRPIVYSRVKRRPINIRTRGTEDYRQLGILSGKNGKVLPLYGRRTYVGSNRWNYFTQANDHLALKIPLSKDGRDCDSNTGCDELYDDDNLHLPMYNGEFSVKLYDTTPRLAKSGGSVVRLEGTDDAGALKATDQRNILRRGTGAGCRRTWCRWSCRRWARSAMRRWWRRWPPGSRRFGCWLTRARIWTRSGRRWSWHGRLAGRRLR